MTKKITKMNISEAVQKNLIKRWKTAVGKKAPDPTTCWQATVDFYSPGIIASALDATAKAWKADPTLDVDEFFQEKLCQLRDVQLQRWLVAQEKRTA